MGCDNRIPLSQKEFTDILKKLKDTSELVDKVNELFMLSRENVECDFCNAAGLQISHEALVVNLLQKLMKDQAEMITFFIYELDYGEEYEAGAVTDTDGSEIDLSSMEALYRYLVGKYEKDQGF